MMKSRNAAADIGSYIGEFPIGTQQLLEQLRATIGKAAPGAEETIKYGMPTYTLNGNLVFFAGYKKHIGFYPGRRGIEAFKKQLSSYKSAKGSVQFPIDRPLPVTLIRRIVRFRVKENLERSLSKKPSLRT